MTLPRLPTTFPYRTQLNRMSLAPAYELLWMNSFSAHSFVAPYRLIGFTALSVLRATTLWTPRSRAASMTLRAPKTFVMMASMGLYSQAGTLFAAPATTTTSTPPTARGSGWAVPTAPKQDPTGGTSETVVPHLWHLRAIPLYTLAV